MKFGLELISAAVSGTVLVAVWLGTGDPGDLFRTSVWLGVAAVVFLLGTFVVEAIEDVIQ